jgi:hypothetical protein
MINAKEDERNDGMGFHRRMHTRKYGVAINKRALTRSIFLAWSVSLPAARREACPIPNKVAPRAAALSMPPTRVIQNSKTCGLRSPNRFESSQHQKCQPDLQTSRWGNDIKSRSQGLDLYVGHLGRRISNRLSDHTQGDTSSLKDQQDSKNDFHQ